MARESDYVVVQQHDGAYRLDKTSGPYPGRVATISRSTDRSGETRGWRLKPLVMMQGSPSRVWPTVAEAIASTRLMTLAAGKRAVQEADSARGVQAGHVP